MSASRARLIARIICGLLYLVAEVGILVLFYTEGSDYAVWPDPPGLGSLAIGAVFLVYSGLMAAMLVMPYWVIVMGLTRMATDARAAEEELGEENTVGDPVEGEKKLHHWLSGAQSTSAYLGMLPTSEPFSRPLPPDAVRMPLPDADPRAHTAFMIAIACGAVALGLYAALASPVDGVMERLARLVGGALLGALMASPVGLLAALLIQRGEDSRVASESRENAARTAFFGAGPRAIRAFAIVVGGGAVWLGIAVALASNGHGLGYRLASGVAGFVLGAVLASPLGVLAALLIKEETGPPNAENAPADGKAAGIADDS